MDNKGYAFTITILIISMILISLLMFYAQTSTTKIKDTTTRITADKIHNFMENTKEDLGRAAGICAKRATVYAINEVKSGETLDDYSYQSCTDFEYTELEGSPAAIVELMVCGTLKGVTVDEMTNNTLEDWRERIEEKSRQLDLSTSVSIKKVDVPLYDPWHIVAIVYVDLNVSDESNTCSYTGYDVPVLFIISLVGLEDPLYPVQSGSMRVPNMFTPCNTSSFTEKVGSGTLGNGTGGGIVYYVANLSVADQKTQITNYVETIVESQGVNVSLKREDTVFVINMTMMDVFSMKTELNQFAGVLNYEEVAMDALGVTVAYISGITVLDSNNRDWVALKNPDEEVVKVHLNEFVDTDCYQWDRLGVWPEAAAGGLIRPSFFDRLDGNLNQSQKYLSQTQGYFGLNAEIGLESFVSLYEFSDAGISTNSDFSWVDYLYWSGQDGCRVYGAYPSLRIDNETAGNYLINDLLYDCI